MQNFILEMDWDIATSNLISISIAYILALPIGWNREHQARSAGLRTFPLVAMGSCGFVLIAQSVFGFDSDATGRVMTGVVTGIGFIGGGAIIKEGGTVKGTATATSVWSTGAIGAAVAFNRYEIAVILSLLTFVTLRFLQPLKSDDAANNAE